MTMQYEVTIPVMINDGVADGNSDVLLYCYCVLMTILLLLIVFRILILTRYVWHTSSDIGKCVVQTIDDQWRD